MAGPYIDAHCHLADPRFDSIRGEVMARARQVGITGFIQGGVDPDDWQRQRELKQEGWFTSFGLHPWWVIQQDRKTCMEAMVKLENLLPEAFALGELGLDFHSRFSKESRDHQRAMFRLQLGLAQRLKKPLVLHLVRCHGEAPGMIKAHGAFKGIVHAFTGSYEVACNYLDLGLLLSIGPAMTQTGYHKLKNAVARLPLSRIIIESDAPDMVPSGFERSLNEPAAIGLTARAVAEAKGLHAEDVLEAARENLAAYFQLELV